MKLLLDSGASQLDLSQLPGDSLGLAFLAAAALQIPPLQKQELLALPRADLLVDRLRTYYRRELALLEVILSKKEELRQGSFSIN